MMSSMYMEFGPFYFIGFLIVFEWFVLQGNIYSLMSKLMRACERKKEYCDDFCNVSYTQLETNYLINIIKTEITLCSHREKQSIQSAVKILLSYLTRSG